MGGGLSPYPPCSVPPFFPEKSSIGHRDRVVGLGLKRQGNAGRKVTGRRGLWLHRSGPRGVRTSPRPRTLRLPRMPRRALLPPPPPRGRAAGRPPPPPALAALSQPNTGAFKATTTARTTPYRTEYTHTWVRTASARARVSAFCSVTCAVCLGLDVCHTFSIRERLRCHHQPAADLNENTQCEKH